jgi:hypothetical protein
MSTRPRAPESLGPAGRATWKELVAAYEYRPGELALLRGYCEQADRLEQAREAVARDGPFIQGRDGPKEHPGLGLSVDAGRHGAPDETVDADADAGLAAPARRPFAVSPGFRSGAELSRADVRVLCNGRSRARLIEHFGSLERAERVWREHGHEINAGCSHFTPIGWWASSSGRPDLADEVEIDPRLPEYDVLSRELREARDVVLSTHPDGARWRSARPLFDPTRRPNGRKETHGATRRKT